MTRAAIASVLASVLLACGPETAPEPEAPGVLEYEHSYPPTRLYRLGRRVDVFRLRGDVERHECGMLSDRALTELEDTLSALDPDAYYGCGPEDDDQDCDPVTLIHIEGFEHSPFACDFPVTTVGAEMCDFVCCQPGLDRAALIYYIVSDYFDDFREPFTIEGEPYGAIEPDEPCPE